jgi:hypothetical protein
MSDRGNLDPIVSHDQTNGKNFAEATPNIKMVPSLKRKIRSELKHATKIRKKSKRESGSSATIDALPWKTLSHAGVFGNTYEDGILEFEEVDNVQVVYEETPEGRVVTFKVRSPRHDSGACFK